MLATKVTCPKCQSALKLSKPVSEGAQLTCPQCKTAFRVAEKHMQAAEPQESNKQRLLVVVGGLVVLAALGGGLLYFLSRGDNSAGGRATDFEIATKDSAKGKAKPLIELTADEETLVKAMTEKGVAWLRKRQNADGTWPPFNNGEGAWVDGVTAMAGLTLLACGADAADPAVVKAAERIRKAAPEVHRTYELALCILFLDRLGDAQDHSLLERFTSQLIAGQNQQGGWNYRCPKLEQKDQ